MATHFSNALQMSNSTDALWRAWVQFVDDTFTGGGWVVTADTGQLTISTSTHPTLTNTGVGYRMYRMDDSLQATAPVFCKVTYGSGAAANNPAMSMQFGTGSDGAGAITGSLGTITVGTGANAVVACNSYGSAGTNRVHLLMFTRAGANDLMCCSVERTKDSTGVDTGDGLLCTYGDGAGSVGAVQKTQYYTRTPGTQPPQENGVAFLFANQAGSTVFGGDVGVGIPIHFKGVAQQPGIGMIFVHSSDFTAEAQPSLTFYGNTHTYQLGNRDASQVAIPTGNAANTVRAITRVGIRFE